MTTDPATDPPANSATDSAIAPTPATTGNAQPTLIARAGQYYRNTRYIMAALTVVMGFWFGYDGFVRWPAENAKIIEINKDMQATHDQLVLARLRTELKSHSAHSDQDIRLQKLLAFGLPPLGIGLLAWALFNSRGEYRLAGETLHAPGHAPVQLAAIRELDEAAWDRKGIAIVRYDTSNGQLGVIKLDDFVYERDPIDLIYERIKAHLQPAEVHTTEPAPSSEGA